MGDRVDYSHRELNRLIAGFDSVDRGIAMAGAISGTSVRREKHNSFDIVKTQFGDREGLAVILGYRTSPSTQINFGLASTEYFDESIMRFGASLDFGGSLEN